MISPDHAAVAGPHMDVRHASAAAFLRSFPNANASTTICQQDLSGGLTQLGELLSRRLGSSCVDMTSIDIDPGQAGAQYDCIVEDLRGSSAIQLAECGATPQAPCWRFETDAVSSRHAYVVMTGQNVPRLSFGQVAPPTAKAA